MSARISREIYKRIIEEGDYNLSYDNTLFNDPSFRLRIANQGYLKPADLEEIVRWKSRRALGHIDKKCSHLKQVTESAFAQENASLANWTLRFLNGVGAPMASAILAAYNPEKYTVIDVRAINTLKNLDWEHHNLEMPNWINNPRIEQRSGFYSEYIELCKQLAQQTGLSLRELDRILYALNGSSGNI